MDPLKRSPRRQRSALGGAQSLALFSMADTPMTYTQNRDRKNLVLIRELLRELPANCVDFIRAIEPTTTTLTRLAYLRDLRLFFKYLTSEVPCFAGFKANTSAVVDKPNATIHKIVSITDNFFDILLFLLFSVSSYIFPSYMQNIFRAICAFESHHPFYQCYRQKRLQKL